MTNEKRYRVGWCVGRRKKEKEGNGRNFDEDLWNEENKYGHRKRRKEWRWEIYQNKKKQTRWVKWKSETAKKMWKEDGIVQNQKREGFVKIEGK